MDVGLSRLLFSHSGEALLLTILGLAVLTAGLAELIDVSAAVGALLAGIVLSGPAAEGARALLAPLRDLFAAIFFAFVGLSVDPSTIPPALPAALALAAVGTVTKLFTGWWGGRWAGLGPLERSRAGASLVSRGEFSMATAGLAASAGLEPRLTSVTVTYGMASRLPAPSRPDWSNHFPAGCIEGCADGYRLRVRGGRHDERSRHQALHIHQGSCRRGLEGVDDA